ncbi:SMEK domain-containing protein [uncultured Marinobacter sp.]|uniref:SMEK domain-containing protein n=1 Tax=uncultured Marinobacter sp. TaxID=187379 RepID=UPI00259A4692|nr:SMEK domain-containing protein [uncultured Marinobacter sp.]|tara:strand:- start:8892 stop:10313 length:1422 start_codon:yes stop_codon:yes gene_type:complete
MKQVEIENQLREVVSRLITEIDLATKQGRLDVNLISEDAWIPILKEVYQCPNLVNLNRKHKNFPGIDLGDEQDRVAFQVTSSTDLEKVKSTLEQFKKRNYKNAFDELYIFTLRSKQKSYSQDAIDNVIGDEIRFDAKEHIIDPGDILAQITGLRLPAQERMLQEFRAILGDVEASVEELNAPENAPYILVSNLIEVTPPKELYVAELCIDEESTIAAAKRDLNYNGRRPNKHLLVRLALQLAGLDCHGWAIFENRIFTFYDMERESAFRSIVDVGSIEELTTEDISQHELVEYQNLFKYLMKDTLRDQLHAFNVNWSKQQNQFYFLPDEKDSEQRREEWVGKKLSRRRVFEKKYQTKDPTKVAFFKHLAFDISFIDVDSQWYATVTPSWYYTWNLYKRNRFHDDLLSKQKRLEHNNSVRDQVRFIGYFLANSRNDNDLISFGELVEFQCLSNISLEENDELEEVLEEEDASAN